MSRIAREGESYIGCEGAPTKRILQRYSDEMRPVLYDTVKSGWDAVAFLDAVTLCGPTCSIFYTEGDAYVLTTLGEWPAFAEPFDTVRFSSPHTWLSCIRSDASTDGRHTVVDHVRYSPEEIKPKVLKHTDAASGVLVFGSHAYVDFNAQTIVTAQPQCRVLPQTPTRIVSFMTYSLPCK